MLQTNWMQTKSVGWYHGETLANLLAYFGQKFSLMGMHSEVFRRSPENLRMRFQLLEISDQNVTEYSWMFCCLFPNDLEYRHKQLSRVFKKKIDALESLKYSQKYRTNHLEAFRKNHFFELFSFHILMKKIYFSLL